MRRPNDRYLKRISRPVSAGPDTAVSHTQRPLGCPSSSRVHQLNQCSRYSLSGRKKKGTRSIRYHLTIPLMRYSVTGRCSHFLNARAVNCRPRIFFFVEARSLTLEKNIVNPRYRSYAKLHVRSTSRWFGATGPTRGTLHLYNSTSIYGCRSRQFHLMRFATIGELI